MLGLFKNRKIKNYLKEFQEWHTLSIEKANEDLLVKNRNYVFHYFVGSIRKISQLENLSIQFSDIGFEFLTEVGFKETEINEYLSNMSTIEADVQFSGGESFEKWKNGDEYSPIALQLNLQSINFSE